MVTINLKGKHLNLKGSKRSNPSVVSPQTQASTKKSYIKSSIPKSPKKDLIILGQKIDVDFFKREFQFFKIFVKVTKAGKVLLGILGGILLISAIFFIFLSGLPILLRILFFLLTTTILLGAFFIEILLLHKKQLLVGVYVTDFYYATAKKVYHAINKQNPQVKPIKAPWLLTQFKFLLRFTFPFFKRITKDEYAKMTLDQKKKYLEQWEKYVAKVKSIRQDQEKEKVELERLKLQKQKKSEEAKQKTQKTNSNKPPKPSKPQKK